MKVRCIRLFDSMGNQIEQSSAVSVGTEYVVLRISVRPGREAMLWILPDDGSGPIGQPTTMFEVVSARIPSNWRMRISDSGAVLGYLDIAPESWLRESFWETYWGDGTRPLVIEDYERELAIIMREA